MALAQGFLDACRQISWVEVLGMEWIIVLWLWIQAVGFFLGLAIVALVIIGAIVWSVGGWLWEMYRKHIQQRG